MCVLWESRNFASHQGQPNQAVASCGGNPAPFKGYMGGWAFPPTHTLSDEIMGEREPPSVSKSVAFFLPTAANGGLQCLGMRPPANPPLGPWGGGGSSPPPEASKKPPGVTKQ